MTNLLLKKTTTMSVQDFLKMERGQISLQEIINKNNTEDFVHKIMTNERMAKVAIFLLACVLDAQKTMAASLGSKGVDILGNKLLTLFRVYGHWILLIVCILECLKSGVNGDSKKILSIIVKFLLVYASLFLVPELFDMITASF